MTAIHVIAEINVLVLSSRNNNYFGSIMRFFV